MTGPVLVDTNVLVYARDPQDPQKQELAHRWIESLWKAGTGRLSHQVLSEFYNTARRLSLVADLDVLRAEILSFQEWKPVVLDTPLFEDAWRVQDRYRISWWDSLIVAAARHAGCRYLLSEDFQHGQDFGGVIVVDPFRAVPDAV